MQRGTPMTKSFTCSYKSKDGQNYLRGGMIFNMNFDPKQSPNEILIQARIEAQNILARDHGLANITIENIGVGM